MVLMEKDGAKKYVPDVFIDYHRSLGYAIVGEQKEQDGVQTSENEVQPRKASTTKKRK